MKSLVYLVCVLSGIVGLADSVRAEHRFRIGGCSDPCGASGCGNARGCSVCGFIGRHRMNAHGNQIVPAGYSVSSGYSEAIGGHETPISQGALSSGVCGACGAQNVAGPHIAGGYSIAPDMYSAGNAATQSIQAQNAELRSLVENMPITMYRVVLEPKYFTESKAVCTTEYQDEVRYRTKTVSRTEPVQVQDYRTKTVMIPKTGTKTIEYNVLVPETSEKTVELTETVPVWNEVPENYTVKVPKIEAVPEEYEVKVPQLRDEVFTYTVMVPQTETQTRMQTVTNAVPVTKTRTVEVCEPTTRMQTVTKDYGHWETRVEEVGVSSAMACPSNMVGSGAAVGAMYPSGGMGISVGGCGTYVNPHGGCGASSAGCGSRGCRGCGRAMRHCGGCGTCSGCGGTGGCGGCGAVVSGCGDGSAYGAVACGASIQSGISYAVPATQTVSRSVWVPNVVTEQVPVVENTTHTQEVAYTVYEQRSEQMPYECTYLVYRPETRTATRKVVDYVSEKRTRTRNVVQYVDETRTRTRRTMTYKQQTRTETIPVVSYRTEKRTKEVSYTFNVPEVQVEPFMTTRYDTVNEQVTEEYTVKVPVATTKEVQVQVCRMVPRLVAYTTTPCMDPSGLNASGNGCLGCAVPCSACQP